MSEHGPRPENNPLLNTQNPSAGGYLQPPASQGSPAGQAGPARPATPPSSPPTLPAAPAAPAGGKKPPEHLTGVAGAVDTIQAVIIALVLALTFRAFVVEAFVIPTGSMAPTLLGAHFNVICPKCGWEFKENADLDRHYDYATGRILSYRAQGIRGELWDQSGVEAANDRTCPNCGNRIDVAALPGNPAARPVGRNQTAYFPWANNGDRILVLKYLYNFLAPQRWDVIVFKEPMRASDNYIKRLIGLPGETVELIAGDVFIDGQIARKPDHVQKEVWQLVYDNDYFPLDAGKARTDGSMWSNPWHGRGATAAAWTIDGPVLSYAGGAAGALEFTPQGPYMYNVLGYNNDSRMLGMRSLVGDLHVAAVWTPADGEGGEGQDLSLAVGMPSNRLKVIWKGDGRLELWRWEPGLGRYVRVEQPGTVAVAPRAKGRSYQVALSNVDRRVEFVVDGKVVLEHQTPWSVAEARAWAKQLDAAPEVPTVGLEVGGNGTVAHLKVMRDLYYVDDMSQTDPASQRVLGPGTATRGHPMALRADEFLALGDNSTMSYDSRGWGAVDPSLAGLGTRPGVIPRRFLLGRAFFVYWPAGYRPMNGAVEPLRRLDVPLVPNVGEMRFIR